MGLWHGWAAALVLGLHRLQICDRRGTVATFLPLPAELPLDTTRWDQIPLVVRHLVVLLRAVIQHQAVPIATLDAAL
jgi:hypothetical protein